MTDVFISYKREERDRCARIAEKLRALGLDVWFDARLESGTSFDAEIQEHVTSAKAVLVLWSPGAVKSTWVRNEATIGQRRDVLVAAELAACDYPVAFVNTHTEKLHDPDFSDDDPAWLNILKRVAQLTGRTQLGFYADALSGAERAKPKASAGALVGAALAGLVLGAGGAWFAKDATAPAAAAPQASAADLVGLWGNGEFTCPNGAGGDHLEVGLSLHADGLGFRMGADPGGVETLGREGDWFKSAGAGPPNFWRRDGDDLLWRAGDAADAANEVRLRRCT